MNQYAGKKLRLFFFTIGLVLLSAGCGQSDQKITYDDNGYENTDTPYDMALGKYTKIASSAKTEINIICDRSFYEHGDDISVQFEAEDHSVFSSVEVKLVSAFTAHKEVPNKDVYETYLPGEMGEAESDDFTQSIIQAGEDLAKAIDSDGEVVAQTVLGEKEEAGAVMVETVIDTAALEEGFYDLRAYATENNMTYEIGYITFKVTPVNEVIEAYEDKFDEDWNKAQQELIESSEQEDTLQ